MKQSHVVAAVILTITLLTFGQVGNAERNSMWQEQTDKQKDRDKDKTKSDEKISGALGEKTNPVRCDMPKGERQYLNRLRCADGNPPEYFRMGSYGLGPYGNILDGYNVKCGDKDAASIFMDMYHKGHVEKETVPGFTIVND